MHSMLECYLESFSARRYFLTPCGCPVVRLQAPVPCEKFASFPLHLHFQFWGSFAISLEKIAKQTEGNTQVLVCPRIQNDCTVSELTYKLHRSVTSYKLHRSLKILRILERGCRRKSVSD